MTAVRRGLQTLVALAVVATLSACVPGPGAPRGGHGAEAAQAQLADVPGVATATVRFDEAWSGLTAKRAVWVGADLEPGYGIGVPEEVALDYLLRLAWSVGEAEPTSRVVISLKDSTSAQLAWDPSSAAAALGLDETLVAPRELSIAFSLEDAGTATGLAEFLGPWPGDLPTPPDGLFAPAG